MYRVQDGEGGEEVSQVSQVRVESGGKRLIRLLGGMLRVMADG